MPAAGGKPTLTMYTKDNCSLCDVLADQLAPFRDRIIFEKVDITREENKNYFDKYRYDIPVLHINGQYLCKHRLDAQKLAAKLNEFEKVDGKGN